MKPELTCSPSTCGSFRARDRCRHWGHDRAGWDRRRCGCRGWRFRQDSFRPACQVELEGQLAVLKLPPHRGPRALRHLLLEIAMLAQQLGVAQVSYVPLHQQGRAVDAWRACSPDVGQSVLAAQKLFSLSQQVRGQLRVEHPWISDLASIPFT